MIFTRICLWVVIVFSILFPQRLTQDQDKYLLLSRRVKELTHLKISIGEEIYNLTTRWIELVEKGQIGMGGAKLVYDEKEGSFYYVIKVSEHKIGPFVLQINPVRGLRPGAVSRGVKTHQQRRKEGKECPFCNQKIINKEKVLDLEINRREWIMVYNPFPIEMKGHFLLIPEETIPWEKAEEKGLQEQTLTEGYVEDMLELINNSKNLVLFFNSIGAGASQPHTHIQAMYHPQRFPVEEAFENYSQGKKPLIGENGVKIWYLPHEKWPATCLVFEGEDSNKVTEVLFSLINKIQTDFKGKISYNLVFTPGKVYLFLRDPQYEVQKIELNGKSFELKSGALEMSGMFIISDEKIVGNLNENILRELLSNATLGKDEIETFVKSLINYLSSNKAKPFPELASIQGLKTDEIEAILNLILYMAIDREGKIKAFLEDCLSEQDNLGLVGLLGLALAGKGVDEIKKGIDFIISQRPYQKDYLYQPHQHIDLIPGGKFNFVLRNVLLKRFASYSQNLNNFKKNFLLLKEWVSQSRPIYSHELVEIWNNEEEWCNCREEYLDGRRVISARFLLTAGGFLIVGVGNIKIIDGLGTTIYLCHNFKSFLRKQRLGREIIARAFKRADQIAGRLGLKVPLAYCYYRLTDYEWDKIYLSDVYGSFRKTPVFKLLNPILGDTFGMNFYERLEEISDVDTRDLISRINRFTEADGGWYVPFKELITEINKNWWDWFYRDRILSFYNGSLSKWEEFQKEHDESGLMKKLENEGVSTIENIMEDLSK